MTGVETIGVFIREKVWLKNSLRLIFSPINTPTFSTPVILHTYLPMKMEQIVCSETLAYKIQMLGSYPEKSIQQDSISSTQESHATTSDMFTSQQITER